MDHGDCDLVLHQSPDDQETDQKPRGLFLRLKIPKTSLDDDDQAGGDQDDDGLDGSDHDDHVCHFCSKKFSSGKALGGHIRVHMKSGRSRRVRSLRPKLAEEEEGRKEVKVIRSAGDGKNMTKCCLCSKEFRSMKSLFGHMRNHPERGWRGIRPPPGGIWENKNNSCSSSVSENELLASEVEQKKIISDLEKALPKGPVVSKKRRRIEVVSDEVPEAAYCLMKLAYSGQSLELGKSMKNPNFVYDDEDKLDQLKGKDKEKKKMRKMENVSRKLLLDFDLNQPYVALDEEGIR